MVWNEICTISIKFQQTVNNIAGNKFCEILWFDISGGLYFASNTGWWFNDEEWFPTSIDISKARNEYLLLVRNNNGDHR